MDMRRLAILFLALLVLASCKTRQKMTDEEALEKGKAISGKLLAALLGELTAEINESGVVGAINYCSLQALPITRQISEDEEVELGRVSHRYRNPLNAASEEELRLIDSYIKLHEAGGQLSPVIVAGKGTKTFYSPILLGAPLCLSCHGKPGEIDPGVLAVINERYPGDKAVNFELNEVRGMFKVVFKD